MSASSQRSLTVWRMLLQRRESPVETGKTGSKTGGEVAELATYVVLSKADARIIDCDSEPTEADGNALASSVGEGLALRLWMMQGVGDDAFPDDFQAWWGSWARQHRLPPLRRYDY